jgi:tripartite-type tricarboxylate transporter receptor subunit TctC
MAALCRLWAALLVLGLPLTAAAQGTGYPNRPVTIIVPFAPGGSTDVLARYDAEVLQRELKQTFVVENKVGAGGTIGIGYVAKAAPDGYTLLHTPTAFSLVPHSYKSLPYDPLKDFDPIAPVGVTLFMVVANPALNINSIADLIKRAKAEPGELTYASAGAGTTQHLFAELFKSMAGVNLRHIPYRGSAPALVDIVSGRVSVAFIDIGPAIELVRGGKLKALAVTSLARNSDLPDLPTVAETLPGYEAVGWQGLMARAGTPKSIVNELNKHLTADLKRPETAERFNKIGVKVKYSSPEEFDQWIRSEIDKWGKVMRAAGIEPQ